MTTLVFLFFPALMIAAAICDAGRFLIPNRLTAALVLIWPIAAMLAGMAFMEAVMAAGLAAVLLLGCFGMFAAGWLGGGDAKLIPAAALWIGPAAMVDFLYVTVLAGAGLALVLLAYRNFPLPVFAMGSGWLERLHERRRDIPYGVAIAAGALFAWPSTPFYPF